MFSSMLLFSGAVRKGGLHRVAAYPTLPYLRYLKVGTLGTCTLHLAVTMHVRHSAWRLRRDLPGGAAALGNSSEQKGGACDQGTYLTILSSSFHVIQQERLWNSQVKTNVACYSSQRKVLADSAPSLSPTTLCRSCLNTQCSCAATMP